MPRDLFEETEEFNLLEYIQSKRPPQWLQNAGETTFNALDSVVAKLQDRQTAPVDTPYRRPDPRANIVSRPPANMGYVPAQTLDEMYPEGKPMYSAWDRRQRFEDKPPQGLQNVGEAAFQMLYKVPQMFGAEPAPYAIDWEARKERNLRSQR
jgi:hypothetical protein